MSSSRQVHELGVFIHGILAGLHTVGILYNVRKRNWFDVVVHVGATIYDVNAVTKHWKVVVREHD